MAGASRGALSWQSFTGSTSGTLTAAWGTGQTHAVPATLVAVVYGANASSIAVTCSTPANWNLHPNYPDLLTNGINRLGLWVFTRDADGTANDNAPSFSVANAAGGVFTVALFDLTGLQGATVIDIDYLPKSFTATGAESLTAASNTTNDFCLAFWGGRGSSPAMTWTAPLLSLGTSPAGAVVADVASARYTAIASQQPAGSSNVGSNVLGAIAFTEFGAPASLNELQPHAAHNTLKGATFT